MSGTSARQVGSFGGRIVDGTGSVIRDGSQTFVRTITPDPNQAVRDASRAGSRSALFVGGGVGTAGVGLGGGYALNRHFQRMETQDLTGDRQNQQQFVEDVLADPNLSDEQKQSVLDEALSRGLLGNVRNMVPESDGAFYENRYFQMLAAIIVLVYLGRRYS